MLDDAGADLGEAAWHENDIVQRFPGGVAWYVVDAAALRERTPYGTVADAIEVARAAGGDVLPSQRSSRSRSRPRRSSWSLRSPPSACTQPSRTRSAASGWTSSARVLDREGTPVDGGLHAAGADAGGIFTGGYGSGLAAALVYGRIAAETALR